MDWNAVKRVLRYLKGTKDVPLILRACDPTNIQLCAFTDAASKQKTGGRGTSGSDAKQKIFRTLSIQATTGSSLMAECSLNIYSSEMPL